MHSVRMVTRKIQGSPVKVTGVTPSDVEYESHLEEDFLVLLRFDRRVEHFERWEDAIVWYDDKGKRRTYTPDFFVRYKAIDAGPSLKPEVIEVKPDFDEDDPRAVARLPRKEDPRENELKWNAATRECKRKGFHFLVKRESDIRTPYLTNAKFLMAYLERGRDGVRSEEILATLKPGARVSMSDLLGDLGKSSEERLAYRPFLYRLIATRQLDVDLTEPLRDSSVIGLPS
ncbi:TnsA endonuclease N-terminal domain-containing protein [Variovorax paradoxus]|uniref:TnsA endonuclease N-terminal domain-containing protein n=1 Tax=Variovorax paradoxus TaxID=34073 RepID=UPI0029C651D7|nr:TnsA endonuclease N-terminal domain-containing protein [Variovorax paradoxus]WPH20800.1 TnsA endonuclease N-terminal domain-containing protein [Variovorax paradoxus]